MVNKKTILFSGIIALLFSVVAIVPFKFVAVQLGEANYSSMNPYEIGIKVILLPIIILILNNMCNRAVKRQYSLNSAVSVGYARMAYLPVVAYSTSLMVYVISLVFASGSIVNPTVAWCGLLFAGVVCAVLVYFTVILFYQSQFTAKVMKMVRTVNVLVLLGSVAATAVVLINSADRYIIGGRLTLINGLAVFVVLVLYLIVIFKSLFENKVYKVYNPNQEKEGINSNLYIEISDIEMVKFNKFYSKAAGTFTPAEKQ